MARTSATKKKSNKHPDTPRLEGWLTANQAADIMGVSRASVARMFDEGEFKTIHAIGERPMRVVRIEEVEEIKKGSLNGEIDPQTRRPATKRSSAKKTGAKKATAKTRARKTPAKKTSAKRRTRKA